MWTAKPENRRLPSWLEHLKIRLLTDSDTWTGPQQKMMRIAASRLGWRTVLVLTALVAIIATGLGIRQSVLVNRNKTEASRLVDRLVSADTALVASIIPELQDYRRWTDPEPQGTFDESADDSRAKSHSAMALSANDEVAAAFLVKRALEVESRKFGFVRQNLKHLATADIRKSYWETFEDQQLEDRTRFRAAAMLAEFDPDNTRWQAIGTPDQIKEEVIPTEDSPIVAIQWFHIAQYCNWLSEKEGLECCHEPGEDGEFGPNMVVKDNFLKLSGYRLPTETEWEFACRAGTTTSRYYGQSEEFLPKHAWFLLNSDGHVWPVGRLKPNDFGLFDMQGNAYEWCHDVYSCDPRHAFTASLSKNATLMASAFAGH